MKSLAATRYLFHPGLRAAVCAVLLLTLLGSGCRSRSSASGGEGGDAGGKGAAQIAVENGRTIITLDAATQQRLGIQLTTLTAGVTRVRGCFPAVVLSAAPLATYRAQYVAMQSQQQKAQIRAAVARKEYDRLQALSAPEQNVSEKSLQAAEAAWQADQADVRAAGEQLDLQSSALRQEWGEVVARWSAANAPQLQGILDRSHALVQMTIPFGSAAAAPAGLVLELPDGRRVAARLVSPFPRVDPRVQGTSFLYLVSNRGELAPGLNLVARFPVGGSLQGVLLPTSAVLWSEGKAWVYTQVAPRRFTRVPAPADLPAEGGYLARHGFASGDKVVSMGAQELLSEEILLHSQGGGDED